MASTNNNKGEKKHPMNSACGCGSGKKFKKCCFLKNAPIDVPHLRVAQLVVDNIWKRFPQSKTTGEYWLTKEELDAFNDLLDKWLSLPANLLEEHGVKAAAYNAIADIKYVDSIHRLLDATKDRLGLQPSLRNHFRTVGEFARIFHCLRMALFHESQYDKEDDIPLEVTLQIEDCIDAFKNMLLVGIHNKTLKELMGALAESKAASPLDTTLRASGNAKVGILIDISKKRVHEVSFIDPTTDVLFWTRKKDRHYSHTYLAMLADNIEAEGRPILATDWLKEQKTEQIRWGHDSLDDVVPRTAYKDDKMTKKSDKKQPPLPEKNWVYITGRVGNLYYYPVNGFVWTIKQDKDKIVGYLRYLTYLFYDDDDKTMSPMEWMKNGN